MKGVFGKAEKKEQQEEARQFFRAIRPTNKRLSNS